MRILVTLLLLLISPCGRGQWPVQVGDLFVANYGGNSVVKIDPATRVQTRLAQFATPTDLALSPAGDLYVTEWGGRIKRLDLRTGALAVVNPTRSIAQPWGIVLGPAGDLYVTSRSSNAVYRVSTLTGEPTLIARGNLLSGPIGIDMLDPGHVVIASHLNNEVVSVDLSDGTQTSLHSGQGLDQPWAIATQGANVFVTGYDSKRIQRLTDGTLTDLASAPGFPYGLDVDDNGNVVCASTGLADSIDRYDAQGTLVATFSGGLLKQVAGVIVSRITLCNLSITCPADVTGITCDPAGLVVPYPQPAVAGGCPPFTVVFDPPSGTLLPPGSNEVECAVTDSNGTHASCTFQITVNLDATPPNLTCPADITVECGTATTPDTTGMATATDVHDPTPRVTFADATTPGTCAGVKTIARVWTAVDACGNSATCTQTITLHGTTQAPVILGIHPAPGGAWVIAFSGDPQGLADFVFETIDSLGAVAAWQPSSPQPPIIEVASGLFEAEIPSDPQRPRAFYRIRSPGPP